MLMSEVNSMRLCIVPLKDTGHSNKQYQRCKTLQSVTPTLVIYSLEDKGQAIQKCSVLERIHLKKETTPTTQTVWRGCMDCFHTRDCRTLPS